MFEVVQAARRRPLWGRRATLLGSIGVHALVLVALTQVAPRQVAMVDDLVERVTFYDVAPPALFRQPEPVATARAGDPNSVGTRSAPRPAAAPVELSVPDEVPVEIPAPSLAPVAVASDLGLAADSLLRLTTVALGARGGAGAANAGVGPADNEPILAALLPKAPRLLNRMEMERVWQRLYPSWLNARGVEGSAVVLFVIGTDGRVEPSSLSLISSTRTEFGAAALEGARKMKFRPAELNGQLVRVRATLPVHFLVEA